VPSPVVVGYDASDNAAAALDEAVRIAKLDGSKLLVVFAFEIPAAWGGETGDYRRAVKDLGEQTLDHAAARLEGSGADFALELVPERPAEALVHVAEREHASAIVVGTHGEHPIKGAILGSVPHKLLHISPVPVLVVPVAE
jgi:nucleotide-binding universal stress UspA family protein